jgi:two-component system, NarL family, nitrate/nitrite response regulator NarL
MLDGLVRVVASSPDLDLAGTAQDLEAAIGEITMCRPRVLIIGQPPTSRSVLPLLARAKEAQLDSHVVLWVNAASDVDSFRALQMGARGVVSRMAPGDQLIECIRAVAGGNVWLESGPSRSSQSTVSAAFRITPREREIIELVCRGMKNKEIAAEMCITPGTVKVHLMHIFEKTGLRDRFQLALRGRQLLGAVPVQAAGDRQLWAERLEALRA